MTTEHDRQYPPYPAGAGPDEADQAAADEHAGPADTADQAAADEHAGPADTADQAAADEHAGPADAADQAAADEHAGPAGQESGTLAAPGALADSGTADSGVLADSGSSRPVEPSTLPETSASAAADGVTDDHRWREILASFVDDPRDAVRKATELIENDVSAYIALLNERQDDMISSLPSDQGAQTEELRQALLACRDFSRRLAASLRAVR